MYESTKTNHISFGNFPGTNPNTNLSSVDSLHKQDSLNNLINVN